MPSGSQLSGNGATGVLAAIADFGVECNIDGKQLTTLTDTGSLVSLLHLGMLPHPERSTPDNLETTAVQLKSVIGSRVNVRGRMQLRVLVGSELSV